MEPQFSKLKGRIVEKYGSQRAFARHIGITEQTVTNKIKGKQHFPLQISSPGVRNCRYPLMRLETIFLP